TAPISLLWILDGIDRQPRLRTKIGSGNDAERDDAGWTAHGRAARADDPGVRAVVADLARREARQRIARGEKLLAAHEAEVGRVADADRTHSHAAALIGRFD